MKTTINFAPIDYHNEPYIEIPMDLLSGPFEGDKLYGLTLRNNEICKIHGDVSVIETNGCDSDNLLVTMEKMCNHPSNSKNGDMTIFTYNGRCVGLILLYRK